jgi:hypothetical protein
LRAADHPALAAEDPRARFRLARQGEDALAADLEIELMLRDIDMRVMDAGSRNCGSGNPRYAPSSSRLWRHGDQPTKQSARKL